MSEATVQARVRVTLQGPAGRCDVAVDPWAAADALLGDDVVAAVLPAAVPGSASPRAALLTRDGSVVDPGASLAEAGVQDGDVLVVVATRGREQRRRRQSPGAEAARGPLGPAPRRGLTAGGALALTGGAAVLAGADPASRALPALLLVALAALAAVLAPADRHGDVVRAVTPLAGGLGLLLLLADARPGSGLLALCAAGTGAAVVAAAGRAGGRGRDEPLVVWLVVGSLVALVFGACLLAGADARAGWCVLGALVLPAVRLLPASVVDVPDTLLLELDRLSVTAWSAHEPSGRRRPRQRLRAADVTGTVAHGQRLHAAGTVAASVAGAVVCVVLALLPGPDGVARFGVPVLTSSLVVGLALCSRAVRDTLSRAVLVLSATVGAAALGVDALAGASGQTRWWAVALLVVAGTAAALAAAALGRGWGSVRWARTGDVVEALAVVVALPAALVAAGGVEWLRQLVS